MTSNIQKDIIMSKIRGQTVKTRQTQSGPLLPVTVLNHFKSEREQTSERYLILFFGLYLVVF